MLQNLRWRALSSWLTASSVALGTALVIAILSLQGSLTKHYDEPGRGYSIVVGAPGSALQLVLSTVYHVDAAPGLMPMRIWWELENDASVGLAIPYAVGDSFRGYRVVATTDAFFDRRSPHPHGEGAQKFHSGRPFSFDRHALEASLRELGARLPNPAANVHDDTVDPEEHATSPQAKREAVLGFGIAEQLGVRVGDHIEPTHGIEGGRAHHREHLWEVVGILRRSDTPIDRVVLIGLDSFFDIDDHRQGALLPDSDEAGLSAVMVFPRPGVHKVILLSRLNRRPELQVADVREQVRHLFDIVGSVDVLLLWIAAMVLLVGLLSILIALYNSMAERRREVAILRALGAPRRWVLGTVLVEASLLSGIGAVVGWLLGQGVVVAVADRVEAAAGFRPEAFEWGAASLLELAVVASVTLAGALAGLGPAWKAYATDVARNLRGTHP